jgi:hypothetical protein
VAENPWTSEDEYTRYLEAERRRYAWVMRTYRQMSAQQAEEAAGKRYPHEPLTSRIAG